ncbi:MAG: hypothetical protein Q9165_002622 [Trypethelium subeluteriae]
MADICSSSASQTSPGSPLSHKLDPVGLESRSPSPRQPLRKRSRTSEQSISKTSEPYWTQKPRRRTANASSAPSIDVACGPTHSLRPLSSPIHNNHSTITIHSQEDLETKVRSLLISSMNSSLRNTRGAPNPEPGEATGTKPAQQRYVPPQMRDRTPGKGPPSTEFIPPHMRKRNVRETSALEAVPPHMRKQDLQETTTLEIIPPHMRRHRITQKAPPTEDALSKEDASPKEDTSSKEDPQPHLNDQQATRSTTPTEHMPPSMQGRVQNSYEGAESTKYTLESDKSPFTPYPDRNFLEANPGPPSNSALPSNPANDWDLALPNPTKKSYPVVKIPEFHLSRNIKVLNGNLVCEPSQQNPHIQQNEGLKDDIVSSLKQSIKRSLSKDGHNLLSQKASSSIDPPENVQVYPLMENSPPGPAQPLVRLPEHLSVATQHSPTLMETISEERKHPPRKSPAKRAPRKKKESAWPKEREIRARAPPPDSNAWGSGDEDEKDENEGGVDSVIADNGWGTAKRPEQDYGYQLQDWDGNWAPAPVDWEDRGCFTDQAWGKHVHEWLEDSAMVPQDKINMKAVGFSGQNSGDVAPKPWIPEHIDGIPVYAWWTVHLKSPLYDGAPDVKPWWNTYRSEQSQVLWPIDQPSTKGPEEDNENTDKCHKRYEDATSKSVSQKYQKKIAIKKAELNGIRTQAIKEAEECRRIEEEKNRNPKPFYLRPLRTFDFARIRDIFNHHVQHSIHCSETTALTWNDVCEKINSIREARLPFLVVVERPPRAGRRPQRESAGAPGDKVLGFAYAKDFTGKSSVSRYTYIIEVFVHPDHYRKQVGTALMDHMVVLLGHPHYCAQTDFELFSEGLPYDASSQRFCCNMVIQMPYAESDDKDVEWVSTWLAKWDFIRVGNYQNIGTKLGYRMNLALFQKVTPLDPLLLEPAHRPGHRVGA